MKIYKVSKQKPLIKLLIYGKPGAGKTLFTAGAMTIPELNDVLFINVEGGLLTIADKEPLAIDIGRNEDGTPSGTTAADLEKVVWNVITKQPGFEKIKTIVVDSATELQNKNLEDVIKEAANKKSRDIDLATMQDYGKDGTRLKRVFRMLKDAPVNVIFTALAKEVVEDPEAEVKRVKEVRPSLTSSVSESLMGYVDFVWFLYKNDKEERFLITSEKGPFRAKTRNPKFAELLGGKVTNPNLVELYTMLCKTME